MNNYFEEFEVITRKISEVTENNFDFFCNASPETVDIDDYINEESFDELTAAKKNLRHQLDEMDEDMSENFEAVVSEILDFYEECIDNIEHRCYSWYNEIVSLINEYSDSCDKENADMFEEIIDNLSEDEDLIEEYIKELSDELADFKKNYTAFYKPSGSPTYEFVDESRFHSRDGYIYKGHTAYKKVLRYWKEEFERISTGEDAVGNRLLESWESSAESLKITFLESVSPLSSPEDGEF